MRRSSFRKYVNQNPELKRWLTENQDWISSNPETMRRLVNQWTYMKRKRPANAGIPGPKLVRPSLGMSAATNTNAATKKAVPSLGMNANRPGMKMPSKNAGPFSKIFPLPRMNLDTLSDVTQNLTKTFGMIENLQTIMNVIK